MIKSKIFTLFLVGYLGVNPVKVIASCIDLEPDFKPPVSSAPGRRIDSGTRSLCANSDKPFAILSTDNNWGETFYTAPTFWLYVPFNSTEMNFTLKDIDTRAIVYQTKIPIQQGKKVISFSLPQNQEFLQSDRSYRYVFKILCNPGVNADTLSLSGIVVRKMLDRKLERDLKIISAKERIKIYWQKGVWFDLANEIIQLRRSNNKYYQEISKCFWQQFFPKSPETESYFENF